MEKQGKFAGELMSCVVCGAELQSHPEAETQWRYLELDGKAFYACSNEFPSDGAGKKAFKSAYLAVLACCMNENIKASGGEPASVIESFRLERHSKPKPKGFG